MSELLGTLALLAPLHDHGALETGGLAKSELLGIERSKLQIDHGMRRGTRTSKFNESSKSILNTLFNDVSPTVSLHPKPYTINPKPLNEQFHEIQQFTNLFNDVTPTVTQYWTGPVEVPNYTLAESQAAGCAMMSR
jgi:hypothetical protein